MNDETQALSKRAAGKNGEDRSLAAIITRELGQEIVSGVIAPGSWLRQDHIAERFQSSHVPVREAFRRLEAKRLLENLPRRGVRVPLLEPDDVQELIDMRTALETLALGRALALGAADLLSEAVQKAEVALGEGEASESLAVWEDCNRRFHTALYEPGGGTRLQTAIAELHDASARYLFAAWSDLDWQPRSDTEHRGLLEAFRSGDRATAEPLLAAHIQAAGRGLIARLRETADRVSV